jgi:hypothetical protein
MMMSWPINLTLGLVRVVAMSGRSLRGKRCLRPIGTRG